MTKSKRRRKQQSKKTRRKANPKSRTKDIRIRDPARFVQFRVISRINHLAPKDQSKVRANVPRNKRAHALYTVGKFKSSASSRDRPKGKTGRPLAWGLQKVQVKTKSKHGVRNR